MKKARSRLNPPASQPASLNSQSVNSAADVDLSPKARAAQTKPSVGRQKKLPWLSARLKHWPTLMIGLIFALTLVALIWLVPPITVKNWLLPNAYLPFFVCLLGASFFLLSFVFLDSAIGLWWTLLVVSLLFLRFQQVVFTGPLTGVFLLAAGVGGVYQWWRGRLRRR